MKSKISAGFILTLIVLSIFTFIINIQPVRASGTIYIRADGSIDPITANITTSNNILYTFTGNINDYIIVEKSNIIIDGNGHRLHGFGNGTGFVLYSVNNVTIKRTDIGNFWSGIYLNWTMFVHIMENNITNNDYGIQLESSNTSVIYHNNFVNNTWDADITTFGYANSWDNGYPSCGNYWDIYNGTDYYSGQYQNETGSDGIADTTFPFDSYNIDHYPLMNLWTTSFTILNRMTVSHTADIGTLDPAVCYDTSGIEILINIYETFLLFDKEKTPQFIPRLATEWNISTDWLTYTFTTRQGVKFHNNDTLTTEDIEYSIERLLVIEGDPAWMFYEAFFNRTGSRDEYGNFTITGQQIDDAVTRTATTVTLHLARPYPPLMQMLAQSWTSALCKRWCIEIGDWPGTWNNWTSYNRMAKTAIENQSTDPPGPRLNAMCGTGPYMLDYYQKGVEWTIVKFDQYWGGWPSPTSKGYLQRIVSKKIVDWETRKKLFLEGELDYTQVARVNVDEVLGQLGIRCYYPLEDLSCSAFFFTFNISTSSPWLGVPGGLPSGFFNESGIPPDLFTDVYVRKGFAYAFNYSKYIDETFRGEAYQPATPIVIGLPFYNPGQTKYRINLTKAEEYFRAAWNGTLWTYGFRMTICYNTGATYRQKAFEIMKANIESINSKFHIDIQNITFSEYLLCLKSNELPIFITGWLADYADPHNFAYGFMYSEGPFPLWQKYSNATLDMLVEEGINTLNETERREIYYELQSVYYKDCPSVPLYQPIGRRFERDWVHGWYYNQLMYGMNYFYALWKGETQTSTRYSWPMFRQNPRHTGYVESPAPNTNHVLWNYTTGRYVASSPAIADGRVYIVTEDDGIVCCLDSLTGARIWNYTIGNYAYSSPAVADGKIYVTSFDFKIYCLDALTGTQIWNYTTGEQVFSSPVVSDGMLFVGSSDGKVYCLDALTGAHIWNYTIGVAVLSSPAVADGKVYVGSDDNKVYCLDALTGAHIWHFTTGAYVKSSPATADGKVYVGSGDNKVYCLNASTGANIWNYATGSYVDSSPAIADGKVYVGSGDGKVYCLDALTGTQIWNYTTGGVVPSSPAVADGKVFVGSYDNKVYCLNASTGANIWNYITGYVVFSSPAIADGVVYVCSYDCKVYAFGNIIRVPEDYGTVQEAIDAATPGATIWIAPGIYRETLVINKTITLLGKKGSEPTFGGGGSGVAIYLKAGSSGSIVAGFVITNWDQGVLVVDSANCKIYDNIMMLMSDSGVALQGSTAACNLIYNNIFQDNAIAINLTTSATNNIIYNNTIFCNNIGIYIETSGNMIYHNSFINNIESISCGTVFNLWDDGYPSGGNYWSTHVTLDLYCGPNQNELGCDGIVDVGYTVAVNNVDRYPLAKPFCPYAFGIVEVNITKTIVGQGFTLHISMKILNYGTYTGTSTIIVYANELLATITPVTLTSKHSTIITLIWNTTMFAKANYAICVHAEPIQGETDTTDNVCQKGQILVSIPGDVTATLGQVDMKDVGTVVKAFGSVPGNPKWNANTDINDDGKVDMKDVGITVKHFGEVNP